MTNSKTNSNIQYLQPRQAYGELPLPIESAGKLSDRTCQVRLQKKIQEALDKMDPVDRTKFLREIITQAVIDRGLLELE